MARKEPLSPEEVTELFSEIDASGVLDPNRGKSGSKRRSPKRVDPLSEDDPSGSNVSHTINRTAIGVVIAILVLVIGMQIGYGVMRRLNTANLSDNVTYDSVNAALQGGLEWGNGFTQFPATYNVDQADERAGTVEVTVLDTTSKNELDLLSNGQIQAAALATNALLNEKINRVVYNVDAYVDGNDNIQSDKLFGLLPAEGSRRSILTFVWTKNSSAGSSNIDWQLRIVSVDDAIGKRIEKQVNSVSSLIEDPAITQNKIDEENAERAEAQKSRTSTIFDAGKSKASADDDTAAKSAAQS